MATTGPPARPWSSSPAAGSGSIPLGRPHPGRCHLMRACLQDDGCTSSRSAGSRRLTRRIPRWRSSSATEATRRLGSSPIRGTVPPIRDCPAASHEYQDFIFPELTALKTAVLVSRALAGMRAIVYFRKIGSSPPGYCPTSQRLMRSLDADRKGAAAVNRELLDWLSRRAQPERPFFAFLNYNDAHYPYELPPGRLHRFGAEPTDSYQRFLIQQWGWLDKTTVSPVGVAFAADAYDDCIADLDEQLGKLVDQLDRRGVLERTWLIITADHGESFGEHAGMFLPRRESLRDRAARSAPHHSARRQRDRAGRQRGSQSARPGSDNR